MTRSDGSCSSLSSRLSSLLHFLLSLSLLFFLSTSQQTPSLQDVSFENPILLLVPSNRDGFSCERVKVTGTSRLNLKSYPNSLRVTFNASGTIPEKLHPKIELCYHRNASMGLCKCGGDEWKNLRNGEWGTVMSPYEKRFVDVKFKGQVLGGVTVSVEEEFQQWRLVFLGIGLVLLLLAPRLSTWVPFYFGSSMACGAVVVVLLLLFQVMKLLPMGKKNILYITLYGSVLGVGSYIANYFSTVVSSILVSFGLSEEMYNPDYRKSQQPAVNKLKEPIWDEIAAELVTRYQLNFTRQDVASLWFLCKQESSLLGIPDQACGLFSPSEVLLLEWTDDVDVFLLKGYGNSINYHMGIPLLKDILQSMEQAIVAKEENLAPGTFEKARLRFAHAETLIPFICLLGLFLDESEFGQISHDQPLALPPMPPRRRHWLGSTIAPFAGNNMLVLFHCPGNDRNGITTAEGYRSKYFVQVLHNEIAVPMPGCGNKDFCPFEVFKERVVTPHLKHEFNSICKKSPKSCTSLFCKLSNWLDLYI